MTTDEFNHIEKFYQSAYLQVRRMLKAKGCPAEHIADYFHESLLLYMFRCREGNKPMKPERFIVVVAHNLYFQELRNQAKMNKTGQVEEDPQLIIIDDPDLLDYLEYYLDQAGEKCKELFEYLIDNLSYREIARLLNVKSARNVKDRVLYCRRKVRELMKEDE